VARAIANNSTLKALHVHGNVLKEDGPKHIARALATNNVSLSLVLSLSTSLSTSLSLSLLSFSSGVRTRLMSYVQIR